MIVTQVRLINARAVAEAAGGQASWGRRLSISRQLASRLIGTNPTKNIGGRLARRIETTFGYPVGWMDQEHSTGVAEDTPFVDVWELNVSALLGAPYPSGRINVARFNRDWLRSATKDKCENLALFTCDADDMAPAVVPGSVLLLDRGASRVSSNGIYVLKFSGGVHVRRAQVLAGGKVRLRTDSGLYSDESIDATDGSLEVLGRVIVSFGATAH